MLALTLVLVVTTFLLIHSVDRFYVETEQLLQDNQFLSGNTYWQEKGGNPVDFQGGQLSLVNRPGSSHNVFQNVAIDSGGFYQLNFEASAKEVVPVGEEDWKNANVAVIFRDRQGERIGSRMLLNLEGSQASNFYSKQFLLKDFLGSVDIAFRLYHSGGEFTILNPVMSQLQELPLYKVTKFALVSAWVILLAIITFFMVKAMGIVQLVMVAILGLLAIVGVLMPEGILTELIQRIETRIPQQVLNRSRDLLSFAYSGEKALYPGAEISKVGHFLLFIGIGFFAGWSIRRTSVIFAASSVAVFALVTEVLQLLVDGRTTRISDLMVDGVGGVIGFIAGATCVWLYWIYSEHDLETSPESTETELPPNR